MHAALGLDNGPTALGGAFIGAAPTSPETFEYLKSIDLVPLEILGATETAGPLTTCTAHDVELFTVGKPFKGMNVRIEDPGPDGVGEICCNGRNTFMGYLWQEDKTRDAFTEDYFYRTGDVGRFGNELL